MEKSPLKEQVFYYTSVLIFKNTGGTNHTGLRNKSMNPKLTRQKWNSYGTLI